MKTHEKRAMQTGHVVDPLKNTMSAEMEENALINKNGQMKHLLIPIVVLVLSTVDDAINWIFSNRRNSNHSHYV
ncbi:hypothetical protein JCM21714_2508 [Gracilibacillus boraciitolerans JCM 21714]|uniref:Uncharacterized protein n=2 Tax=Gracilibacillus boraciitolerans TaxID=307521 RepID=W4VJW3_9BACI|nr:hypothetical protein JCM21714_2508 [Gracilibacillus boraciitolerans JCM 21714]